MISRFTVTIGVSSAVESNDVKWWANAVGAGFVVSSLLQTVEILSAKTSEHLFECFSVLNFCCMGLVKLYSLRKNRKHWLNLVTLMRQLEAKHVGANGKPDDEYDSDDDSLNLVTCIEEYTTQFESSATLLSRVYKSTAVGFIMSPFIEYVYVRVTGGSPELPHVLPTWSPLEQMHIAGYFVTVLLELVVAFYCVDVHLAFDRTSVGMMMFAKGQFLLLRRYCENIAGKGNKCNVTRKRDRRAMHRIKYSHQTSVIVIEFVDKLGKLLSDVMGIYYIVITVTLCTVAIRMQTEVLSTTQMASLLQYLGTSLLQLYIFCYYGDAVQEASTVLLGQGPSGAAYWCLSPKVRRNLVLLSIGMSQPRRLRAGPFNYLDLPSFTMIVRAAYSYYAVLHK